MTPSREFEIELSAETARARLYVYNSPPLDLKVAIARIGDFGGIPRASVNLLPKRQMKYDEAYTDCNRGQCFYRILFPTN